MAQHHGDQGTIRQHLLGRLTDKDQQEVEERLLTEANLLEELEVEEDELIDEYIAGKLTADERDCFERHFLAPAERQQKLRFARTLRRYVSTSSHEHIKPIFPLSSSIWNRHWAIRTVAVVSVAGILTGLFWFYRAHPFPPQTFSTVTLTMGPNNRSEGLRPTAVRLPLTGDTLRIVLELPAGATPTSHYRLKLVNEDGEITNLEVAEHDTHSVSAIIPAASVKRGSYALQLYTITTNGSEQRVSGGYYFNVE